MIPGLYRFHGHNSLRFVYSNGRSVRSRVATIKYVPNARRSHSRAAVVVSKKVIKGAVGRNRIRRRVYEYIRQHVFPKLSGTYDIVVIVSSPDLAVSSYDELASQFDQLFQQTDLYKSA